MIWNGVKAASNQAKERIDRKLLASFGSNNRHGNPRHVDIKSSLGGGHCRIDLYEKATERSGWLLGCVTLRGLLQHNHRGLPMRRYQVWTALHNFDCRAVDGTTPASRFFRRSFPDLFESVLSQIDELPMPRQRRQALVASH